MLAFNGSNGDILKVKLRLGNQYTSKRVKKFIELLLKHYEVVLPVIDILVRKDSGFVMPDVYELFEEHNQYFIIHLLSQISLIIFHQKESSKLIINVGQWNTILKKLKIAFFDNIDSP